MREYIRSLKMVPCIPYFGESSACGRWWSSCEAAGRTWQLLIGWEALLGSLVVHHEDMMKSDYECYASYTNGEHRVHQRVVMGVNITLKASGSLPSGGLVTRLGSLAVIGSDVRRRLPARLRGFWFSGWLK